MPAITLDHASMSDLNRIESRDKRPARLGDAGRTDDAAVTRRQRTQTFDYVWRSFVAGGLAGCVAKTVVAPLDRVKILFQASSPQFASYSGSWFGVATAMRHIIHTDGMLGLFKGHSATLLRIFPYASMKFVAYEQLRAVIIPNKEQETAWRRLLTGSLAGVTSVFVTYPLDLIRVRLAFETTTQGRSSILSICRQVYHEQPRVNTKVAPKLGSMAGAGSTAEAAATTVEGVMPRTGIANFYRGFAPTVIGMLPYAGVSFLVHDTARDLFRHPLVAKWTLATAPTEKSSDNKRGTATAVSPLRSWAQLTAGGLAGMIAQTASYPLEIIRRRMQVSGAVGTGQRLSFADTFTLIVKERGVRGFFVGLSIGYVKTVPMVAASFFAYERFKVYLGI